MAESKQADRANSRELLDQLAQMDGVTIVTMEISEEDVHRIGSVQRWEDRSESVSYELSPRIIP